MTNPKGVTASPEERDPRLSPQKGDVLRADGRELSIKSRRANWLTVDGPTGWSYMKVKHWRAWAEKATVIKRGDQ